MKLLKWIIILLSFSVFGYMTYDGTRGLMVGDYLRPQTGEYTGKLGPWADLVNSVGINPESNFMKWTFIAWGSIGLFIMVSFAMNVKDSERALLILSVLTLWYMMMGTMTCGLIIVLTLIYILIKQRSDKKVLT